MRSYWIQRGHFANQYGLVYCNSSIDEEQAEMYGYERITRREAIAQCVAERKRAKENPNFSGYDDSYIYPFIADHSYIDFNNYPWAKIDYFVVKIG